MILIYNKPIMKSKPELLLSLANRSSFSSCDYSKAFSAERGAKVSEDVTGYYNNKTDKLHLESFKEYFKEKEEEINELEGNLIKAGERLKENGLKNTKGTFCELILDQVKELELYEYDNETISESIRDKIKENNLLRCLLRQIEGMILRKENWSHILSNIQQVNNATNNEEILLILQNKSFTKPLNGNEEKRAKKSKSIVIIKSQSIDDKKEKELRNTILMLNNRIERQLREIKVLKDELARMRDKNYSLAALFESCVNQYKKLNLSIPILDASSLSIDQFSSLDKEELLKHFLKNDVILKRLHEIMRLQFTRNVVKKAPKARNIPVIPATTTNKGGLELVQKRKHSAATPGKNRKAPYPVQLNMAKIVFQGRPLPKVVFNNSNALQTNYINNS